MEPGLDQLHAPDHGHRLGKSSAGGNHPVGGVRAGKYAGAILACLVILGQTE
jgi:hypothetical protein